MNKKEIVQILHEMEKKNDIEILYACEVGSRVWGFENDESDYDVRFIYKHRDVKDYLTLKKADDFITCSRGDLDIVGWDIKKAMLLHYKDNPSLREWFYSNQIYIDHGVENIFSGLGGFNINVLKNHYAKIALKHWRKYSSLEFSKVKTKKYLYVIRSILCWSLLNRDIYPPINIHELIGHDFINLNEDIKKAIVKLIDYHKGNGDLSEKTVFKLNNFILDSLNVMKTDNVKSFKSLDDYDERFRELLLVCR